MNDKLISVVINLDSRPGFLEKDTRAEVMSKGTRSIDYFTDGVINKIEFFNGFNVEVIVFIDQHEQVPTNVINFLLEKADGVVFSKHREFFDKYIYFPKWNDINFLHALMLARGSYIAHFDADMAAFCKDQSIIREWIDLLDNNVYDYISYPSKYSPRAVNDPDFDYMWASTRFFLCKQGTIPYDEVLTCIKSSEYLYRRYGDRKRKCPWLEHILGLISGKVFYPPMQNDRALIFSWHNYKGGTYSFLKNKSYDEIKTLIDGKGGISYPCDVENLID